LEPAALPLGHAPPDAEPLVMCERVLQALRTDLAAGADPLGLPGGAALLREERLRVGLGAQRALLPVLLVWLATLLGHRQHAGGNRAGLGGTGHDPIHPRGPLRRRGHVGPPP